MKFSKQTIKKQVALLVKMQKDPTPARFQATKYEKELNSLGLWNSVAFSKNPIQDAIYSMEMYTEEGPDGATESSRMARGLHTELKKILS